MRIAPIDDRNGICSRIVVVVIHIMTNATWRSHIVFASVRLDFLFRRRSPRADQQRESREGLFVQARRGGINIVMITI